MQLKKSNELLYRSEFLAEVIKRYAEPGDTILEIGCGDNRNVDYLTGLGYNVTGIDKLYGTPIEDYPPNEYDIIFTMSTLFLIPPENNWVFAKIAKMAKKYIITIEGETTDLSRNVYGRDYSNLFPGFEEIANQFDVFNEYGVLRILKKCNTET